MALLLQEKEHQLYSYQESYYKSSGNYNKQFVKANSICY